MKDKLTDNRREKNIQVLCDMYSPSSYTLFRKHMPEKADDEDDKDFLEYFGLIQGLLAVRGSSNLLDRREFADSGAETLLKKYGFPESIATNLKARKSNDALNSI